MSKLSEEIKRSIAQAFQELIRYIDKATFDRTTDGQIEEVLGNNTYVVSAFGSKYTIKTDTDTTFAKFAKVRVTVPQNNYSLMYIVNTGLNGKSDSGGVMQVNGKTGTIINLTTDNIPVGSVNKYFTTALASANFEANFSKKTTSNVPEGNNLYYTDARADARTKIVADALNGRINSLSTSNVAEGGNLYFTDARATANFNNNFGAKTTDNIPEGTVNKYYSDELVQAAINANILGASVLALRDADKLVVNNMKYIIDGGLIT